MSFARVSFVSVSFAGMSFARVTFADMRLVSVSFAGMSFVSMSFARVSVAGMSVARVSFAGMSLVRFRLARAGIAGQREFEILQPDDRRLVAAIVVIRRRGMTERQPLQALPQVGWRAATGPVSRTLGWIRAARRVSAASVCARSLVRRVLRPWHRANLPNSATGSS